MTQNDDTIEHSIFAVNDCVVVGKNWVVHCVTHCRLYTLLESTRSFETECKKLSIVERYSEYFAMNRWL